MNHDDLITKNDNDAAIIVVQDNSSKELIINDLNDIAENITGYKRGELVNKPLSFILPQDIQDSIVNYVEFKIQGNDLADVFRKIHHFHIIKKDKKPILVELKIFHTPPEDASHNFTFELLIRDIRLETAITRLKEKLAEEHNESNFIEAKTKLPNIEFLKEKFNLIQVFEQHHDMKAVIAVINIDGIETILNEYDEENYYNIIYNVVDNIHENINASDTVSYLGNGQLGLILFNCDKTKAEQTLISCQDSISENTITIDHENEVIAEISACYTYITANNSFENTIESCKQQINKTIQESYNIISEFSQ